MKKSMVQMEVWKKLSIFLIPLMMFLAISLSLTTNVTYAEEQNTTIVCNNFSEIASITKKEYQEFDGDYEPIGICKAKLINNNKIENVYLVTLLGTKFAYNKKSGWQATDIINDVLAGFDINNPYLDVVKNAILSTVPQGSKIVIFGHSLGGMVAQEVAGDTEIKDEYQILNTVAFGSPLCAYNNGREGVVKRMCDKRDIIPLLSKYTLTNYQKQMYGKEKIVEDGGYSFFSMIKAHCKSYQRSEIWGKYDTLGVLGGSNHISFDYTQMHYFQAPMF